MKYKKAIFNYILPLVLISLIVSISTSTIKLVHESSTYQLRTSTISKLESTIAALDIWVKKSYFQAQSIASSEYIYEIVANPKALIKSKISRATIGEYLLDVIVLNDNGEIIFSSDENALGQELYASSIDFWNNARSTKTPFLQKPFINTIDVGGSYKQMFIAAPIYDETSTFSGLVVLVYDPTRVLREIFDYAKMGESGEVYAFDGSGLILNDSRFDDHLRDIKLIGMNESSGLKLRLFDPGKNLIEEQNREFKKTEFTLMVRSALNFGNGENFEGYRDYRGVPVVGAWRWLDRYGIGIAAEVDVDEAYRGKNLLNENFTKIFLLLGVFILLYIFYNYEESKLRESIEATNKLLKQKNLEIEQFFKTVSKHVLISKTDTRGVITYANENFEKASKFKESELIGKNHNIVRSDFHGKDFFKEMWDTLKSKKVWHGIIMNKAKDESHYWVDTTITPILDDHGKIKEFISVRTDVTNTKEIEQALKKAKRDAERLAKMRSNFIANVSHELRTPLNAIIGFLNIIKEGVKEPQILEQVQTVCDASENLLEIINDILDFSRIEEGEVKVVQIKTDLEHMIQDIYRLYKIKETEYVKLILTTNLQHRTVLFDRVKLRQIISNIVGNAFKFTPRGTVEIKIDQTIQDAYYCDLEITISDTGRGIPEDKLFTIFNPFKQVEDEDVMTESGVGLGLAIVDSYTKILGGSIVLDSRVEHGTTFKLKFKNVKLSADEDIKVVEEFDISIVKGKKALVVDDNMINLKMMRATLEKVGIDVVLEQNPLNTEKLISDNQFDIIFMDQLMPQMNGTEVVTELRKEFDKLPPVISLSASTTIEDLKIFHEKFDEVLSKPLKRKDLEYVLKRLFKKS
ncbi:hybrid sensor histidine kinase/response regulator [Bacteriovorax sp. Seq25_V]|uniref:hybrid sensor histidine kinase/response regulator n=1 Tax=Bacteriovorax sp. Seq25_V TaxID=1201288 RepID=UPI000389F317|nr:hybrid sensor histidine kinase/response regulator [Bacteriovorax sp. Seq25_V]EQC46063.1 PAS domain S-box protein [Bacteriovorax sp. Seq25_V]